MTVRNTAKPKFSVALHSDLYQNLIQQTLSDKKRVQNFVASISSAVATNPTLQDCSANSIISGALLGESLGLSPSPQMGHYYLVPYNDKNQGKVAQFQLGWKGYYQLALNSGLYKKLHAVAIKEGELVSYSEIYEEAVFKEITDPVARAKAKTIGYFAFFEQHDGLRKELYFPIEKMQAHATQYSQGYRADRNKGTKYTFWSKDFDSMAIKTMYRQLISKFGKMSTEMQRAYTLDQSVVTEGNITGDEPPFYVDNTENERVNVDDIQDQVIEAETTETPVESVAL